MKLFIFIIQWIWELPQNLIGILVMLILFTKIRRIERWRKRILVQISGVGVSLGSFIFWYDPDPECGRNGAAILRHELGHSIQSIMLGPLYLFAVGIPSACRYLYALCYYRIRKQSWPEYYHGYPEAWAERLGSHFYSSDPPENHPDRCR